MFTLYVCVFVYIFYNNCIYTVQINKLIFTVLTISSKKKNFKSHLLSLNLIGNAVSLWQTSLLWLYIQYIRAGRLVERWKHNTF